MTDTLWRNGRTASASARRVRGSGRRMRGQRGRRGHWGMGIPEEYEKFG